MQRMFDSSVRNLGDTTLFCLLSYFIKVKMLL